MKYNENYLLTFSLTITQSNLVDTAHIPFDTVSTLCLVQHNLHQIETL